MTIADGPAPVRAAETWFARILARWPATRRRQVATVIALVAILVATLIASSRILRLLYQELDILAYAGLFAACWVGAGGALVPIPGVRPISWFMIVQQGAALDPAIVAVVAAIAMTLGQTSYFLAARAARRRAIGHAHPAAALPPDLAVDADLPPSAGLASASAADPADPPNPAAEPPPGRRAQRMEAARRRVTRQVQTHGVATVFAVCALPTPLTTLTTTAAAAAGMGYARYLPAAFAGYLVLSAVLVLFGQGLGNLVHSLVPF